MQTYPSTADILLMQAGGFVQFAMSVPSIFCCDMQAASLRHVRFERSLEACRVGVMPCVTEPLDVHADLIARELDKPTSSEALFRGFQDGRQVACT